jgi:NAD-reducing hydrogenase small subunit
MSFLDMDQRLIDLAGRIQLVYSPLVDAKQFPDSVDIAIVEGAVSSEEDLHKIRNVRRHSKFLMVLGDCAITGNVPSMRNPFSNQSLFDRAYRENAATQPQVPTIGVPALLDHARPVHEYVKVDLFVPGCPPPADAIHFVISEMLDGRTPEPSALTRFGK